MLTQLKPSCLLPIALSLVATIASADSLELKNGSLIKGKFMGGTENEVSFQVGSSVQKYSVADIVSLEFDSGGSQTGALQIRPKNWLWRGQETIEHASMRARS